MNYNKQFTLFARDYGFNSVRTEEYLKTQMPNNLTPYILEEREMNVTQMDVYSRLMKDRVLFFAEDVRDDNMSLLIAQYLFLNSLSDDPIKMYLSSPGGGVVAGLGLIDTILSLPSRFEPVIIGMGASMGSVLGSLKKLHKDDKSDTISRRMLKHSRLMIHDIRSGIAPGTPHKDQLISIELSKELRSELFQILSNNSKFTPLEIEEMCDRDLWIKSDKALEYGFTDEIIQHL